MSDCELYIDIRGFIKSKLTGNSHTYETALCEIIHNSISAKANNIYILHNQYNNPIIVDDGLGMDKLNIDKLKKFYDSSKRIEGTIGTYNIGLKEAMLKFGGKWIILSKKKNIEDIVYCEFNGDNLEKFAYGGEYIDCIDSGFTNKARENIFINILDELGLINKNKETTLKKFSGTVIYQLENNELNDSYQSINYENNNDYENNKATYITLYKNLKLKLSQYNCNFIYGSYTINNNNNILINDSLLTTIDKMDWLCWSNNYNSIEFNILVYKTTKNTLFAIQYENTIYKFNKSKNVFDKLKCVNSVGSINIKINILNNTQHTTQELYYKYLNYKSSINGIILNRNGLDLYDFPNKYDNVFIKDTTTRKFARIFVSFIGNEDLDTIFNILPNKSLFLPNNLNNKLKSILELIKNNVYEYLDLQLLNMISIKQAFKYILENLELEDVRNKIKNIQNNWKNIINIFLVNKQLKCINIFKEYILCKKIKNYYDKYNTNIIQNTIILFKNNYTIEVTKMKFLNNIIKFQYKFKYIKSIKIFKRLGLCIVISKMFHSKNILKKYFNYIKNNMIVDNNIKHRNKIINDKVKLQFITINNNIHIQKKFNQLMLLKYNLLYNKYINLLII